MFNFKLFMEKETKDLTAYEALKSYFNSKVYEESPLKAVGVCLIQQMMDRYVSSHHDAIDVFSIFVLAQNSSSFKDFAFKCNERFSKSRMQFTATDDITLTDSGKSLKKGDKFRLHVVMSGYVYNVICSDPSLNAQITGYEKIQNLKNNMTAEQADNDEKIVQIYNLAKEENICKFIFDISSGKKTNYDQERTYNCIRHDLHINALKYRIKNYTQDIKQVEILLDKIRSRFTIEGLCNALIQDYEKNPWPPARLTRPNDWSHFADTHKDLLNALGDALARYFIKILRLVQIADHEE